MPVRRGAGCLPGRSPRRPHGRDADGGAEGHGAGGNAAALGTGYGAGLAGEHRFVEVRLSFGDGAIRGDAGTGPHEDDVAGAELGDGDPARLPVLDALGFVGEERREGGERASGEAEGAHLLPVAEQHDGDQRRELPPELEVDETGLGGQAGEEGDGNGERDEKHHAGLPPAQLLPTAAQEDRATVEEDDRAEDGRHQLVAGDAVEGVAEPVLHHLAEGDDRDCQQQREPEAAAEGLGVVPGVAVVRLVGGMGLGGPR